MNFSQSKFYQLKKSQMKLLSESLAGFAPIFQNYPTSNINLTSVFNSKCESGFLEQFKSR